MPTSIPNLLLNGSSGIAVGMTADVPPHHLGGTLTATINLIHNQDLITNLQEMQSKLYLNAKSSIEFLRASTSVSHEELVGKMNEAYGAGTIINRNEVG